jgi:amicoumacin kinase
MKIIPDTAKNDLCRRFDADLSSLRFLGGGQDWSDGTLFTFEPVHAAPGAPSKAGSAPPMPMVIKILELKESDREACLRAEERVAFMRHLADHGARVIVPEPSREGRIFESVREGSSVYTAYVYAMVRGRPLDGKDGIAHAGAFYRAMGDVVGRLHAISEARSESLSPDGSSTSCAALRGWREEWSGFRSWCRDDEVGAAWEHLRTALERLPVDKPGYGLVHNDAHVWNLLFDPESPAVRAGQEPDFTLIDFDVANFHWFMNDSAVALYSMLIIAGHGIETEQGPPPGFRERAFGEFWEGYGRHRDPGRSWLSRLDLFLQYRRCLLFMPFQEETAKQPAWRKRWKDRIRAEDERLFG